MTIIKPPGIYIKYTTWENDHDCIKDHFKKCSDLAHANYLKYIFGVYGVSGYSSKLGMTNTSKNHSYVEEYINRTKTNFTFSELLDDLCDYAETAYDGDIRVIENVSIVKIIFQWGYDEIK